MKGKCNFEDCNRDLMARGYCHKHYNYIKRLYGVEALGERKPIKKIDFEVDENGCFNCTSHAISPKGYPVFGRRGRSAQMSRFIYTEMFGEIPEGLVIRHTCDNRKCINPEHLITGTPKENSQDMVIRGRSSKGEKCGSAKLTEVEVLEVKKLLQDKKLTQYQIADIYSVTRSAIQAIHRGVTWKYLTN